MKIYLIKTNNKYQVKKEGSKRASKTFTSYEEAKKYATKLADSENATLVDKVIISKVAKSSKKTKIALFFIFLILVIGIVIVVLNLDSISSNFKPVEPSTQSSESSTKSSESSNSILPLDSEFVIHFLELGNEYAGDATYIKINDIDILIDAGSRKSSSTTISAYIDQYCTDGKLEYVIATHAHQDHIAGFVGNTSGSTKTGIFYQYEIETIIDFPLTNATSQIYKDYVTARDYAVAQGATHFSADSFFDENKNSTGSIELAAGTYLDILYNRYYFEKSSDENDYSVCTLFTHNKNKFLLTGDLEAEGEDSLVEYYSTHPGLSEVDVFKAGHHGSPTSSNDALLNMIKPKICSVCCCAGSTEYTANYQNIFPSQAFISRIAKYTERVYVTTVLNEKTNEYESLNGNITIQSNGVDLTLSCSNNDTILKDSSWFNETIYVKDNLISSGKGKKDFYTATTPGVEAKPRRVWS